MAPDAIALAKFACPACGGEAIWNPERQLLVCPYCGTASDAAPGQPGRIVEHDLVAALARADGARGGWQDAKREVLCRSCNAISVLDPARQAQQCAFCGAAQLVPYESSGAAFTPESVLPLRIAETEARDAIRAWYGRLWLAPGALKRRALTDTARGAYLPYWTFDAAVRAAWSADAGHYYTTTETVMVNGRPETRSVRHVRWEPASGSLEHCFDDDLVCASVGVHPALMRGVEPFPTVELQPYAPGYVAGWVVERYQIDLAAAAQRARAAMDAKVETLCAGQIPGDTYRNLVVHADYAGQTFKHMLAPVWLVRYTYGARTFQCVMNGVTGAIRGEYPKSPWKIAFLVLLVVIAVLVMMMLGGRT
ncbi:MAG: zinc ribbon domain-containing protein [Casimicrobiaceae bacterium]